MIKNIKAKPSSYRSEVVIEIEFDQLTKPLSNFIFSLERAETKDGPWINISYDINSVYMKDSSVNRIVSPGNSFFYRVKARERDGEVVGEAVTELDIGKQDKYALAIERNYERYLNAQEGNEFYLLKKSKLSEYCACFDDVRMESQDPNCEICGGTGYVGSFFSPVEIKLAVINAHSNEALIKELFGEITVDTTAVRAWATGKYKISTEDILVSKYTNEAFEVDQVSYSMRLTYMVRQSIVMKKLEQDNYIYKTVGRLID
jgi:hypothetical protein